MQIEGPINLYHGNRGTDLGYRELAAAHVPPEQLREVHRHAPVRRRTPLFEPEFTTQMLEY